MDELVAERVLRAVELVPRGRVVSYGDLAELVGIGARQVGAIMHAYGDGVTWWRVTSSYGDLTPELLERALPHWTDEGIVLKPNGRGCRIAEYRADLRRLGREYAAATSDLEQGRRTP